MTSSRRRPVVVLDVDGTLADTNYHHTMAWARAFADVAPEAQPPLWELHRAIGMGGDKLVAAVADATVEKWHGDALRAAWEREYAALLPEVRLLPGARDLVLALARRGLTLVLATSGTQRFTDHVLELLDLPDGVLAAQASSDEAEESKPAPDVLQVALEKAGADSALVIGDTPYDVAAAGRLGMACAAVRTGGFGEDELSRAGAVIVVDTPADLTRLDDATWEDLLTAGPPPRAADTDSPLPGVE